MATQIRYVLPNELRLPGARANGADPAKLARQIAKFGALSTGMPVLVCYEGLDGMLQVYDGVTRATRIAKLAPGTPVPVEIVGRLARRFGTDPSIGDLLP